METGLQVVILDFEVGPPKCVKFQGLRQGASAAVLEMLSFRVQGFGYRVFQCRWACRHVRVAQSASPPILLLHFQGRHGSVPCRCILPTVWFDSILTFFESYAVGSLNGLMSTRNPKDYKEYAKKMTLNPKNNP